MSENQSIVNAAPLSSKKAVPRIEMTGQRFGTLTALRFVRTSEWGTGWECRCDCGTIRVINGYFLRNGFTRHCGCLGNNDYLNFTNNHHKKGKHFSCWCGMMTRCFNSDFKGFWAYGGKGVTVCEHYQNPGNLAEDLGERPSRKHTLERRENKGHYSCGKCMDCWANGWSQNVVWATYQRQARNRSSNHMITYKGETLCMMDMAEKHGISYFVLRNRLTRDAWSVEDAIEIGKLKSRRFPENALRGSQLKASKLDEQKVKLIRDMHAAGVSQTLLSKEFGVSKGGICLVVNGVTWKHVK